MTRNSFVFYRSFYESCKNLNDKDKLEFYEKIFNYVFEDEVIETSGVAEAMFNLSKTNIDNALSRYDASVNNGKKGGRPKTKQEPRKNLEKPSDNLGITKQKPSNNLNVDVDVNVDVDDDKDDNANEKNNVEQTQLETFLNIDHFKNTEANNLLIEFVKTKKGSRTLSTAKRIVKKLSTHSSDEVIEALETALNGKYGDVFPKKKFGGYKNEVASITPEWLGSNVSSDVEVINVDDAFGFKKELERGDEDGTI